MGRMWEEPFSSRYFLSCKFIIGELSTWSRERRMFISRLILRFCLNYCQHLQEFGLSGEIGQSVTHLAPVGGSSDFATVPQLIPALATQQRQHHAHRTPLVQVKAFQIVVNLSVNKIIHQRLFLWISSTLPSPPQATWARWPAASLTGRLRLQLVAKVPAVQGSALLLRPRSVPPATALMTQEPVRSASTLKLQRISAGVNLVLHRRGTIWITSIQMSPYQGVTLNTAPTPSIGAE